MKYAMNSIEKDLLAFKDAIPVLIPMAEIMLAIDLIVGDRGAEGWEDYMPTLFQTYYRNKG